MLIRLTPNFIGISYILLKDKAGDMTPGPLANGSILGRAPAHIAEIADLRADGREDHQHPFIDRVDTMRLPFCCSIIALRTHAVGPFFFPLWMMDPNGGLT